MDAYRRIGAGGSVGDVVRGQGDGRVGFVSHFLNAEEMLVGAVVDARQRVFVADEQGEGLAFVG
jgi:hypothetical protein